MTLRVQITIRVTAIKSTYCQKFVERSYKILQNKGYKTLEIFINVLTGGNIQMKEALVSVAMSLLLLGGIALVGAVVVAAIP